MTARSLVHSVHDVGPVISREEVDALLGVDPEPAGAAVSGGNGTVLTPGQSTPLLLDLPLPPARLRAARHPVERPIDTWPEATLPPAAVAVWLRRPGDSRRAEASGIDFWPAYADVLSNVVLNLLFLVGTLTLGLIVLNQEVVGFQKRLAEASAQEALRPSRPPAAPARGGDAAPAIAAGAVQAAPPAPPAPPPPAQPEPAVAAVTAAPVASARDAAPRPQREFSMRSETGSVSAGSAGAAALGGPERRQLAEARAQSAVGGRHAATLVFDLRETRWPASRPLVGAEGLGPEDRRALVAFAPAANRRLMADAFSRLASVREAMIAAGVPATRIDLRIAPVPPELENDESVSGSVYVIKLGGS